VHNIVVVTDSIACLPAEIVEKYRIKIVPVNMFFSGKVYRDGIDISASEAYELLRKAPNQFVTSPASAGDYLDVYRELSSTTENIFCITISSKLSATYTMAKLAKEEAKKELPETTIEVLDSQMAAGAEGLIVLAAARAVAQGKDLKEAIDVARQVREKTGLVGILETIRHVHRTGRVPKIASFIGSVIRVKPLVTISDGSIHFAGLARTKRRGIDRILSMIREKIGKNPIRVSLMHAEVPEEAFELKERILSEFNCVELWLTHFTPIMGYATGPGTLVIAFHPEQEP